MKDTCFLAPIHRKGFDFGREFVKSYNRFYEDDDLFLVFSNQEELDDFRNIMGSSARYRSILCTEKLEYSKPISQKKLFGVKHVFDNYDFKNIAITDVDCLFIKTANYDDLIKTRIANKKLYVSKSNNPGIVDKVGRQASKKFFNNSDVEFLDKITQGFIYYFWFNDVPIYRKENFNAFLNYIDYPASIKKLEYTTFDFILYAFYMLLKGEIELEVISVDGKEAPTTDKGSFIEAQKCFKQDYFKKAIEKINPMWLCDPTDGNSDVILRLHVDRK